MKKVEIKVLGGCEVKKYNVLERKEIENIISSLDIQETMEKVYEELHPSLRTEVQVMLEDGSVRIINYSDNETDYYKNYIILATFIGERIDFCEIFDNYFDKEADEMVGGLIEEPEYGDYTDEEKYNADYELYEEFLERKNDAVAELKSKANLAKVFAETQDGFEFDTENIKLQLDSVYDC